MRFKIIKINIKFKFFIFIYINNAINNKKNID